MGSTSAWISRDTVMLLEGFLASTRIWWKISFMYSQKYMDILSFTMGDISKLDETFTGNSRLIECDICGKDIHLHCDKKIMKFKKKAPECYKCPMCSNKKQDKGNNRKRKRGQ